MKRHSIVVRLRPSDKEKVSVLDDESQVSNLNFISSNNRLDHGLGQMVEQLAEHGMSPSETAIDLAILAAAVTAADTRISRSEDSQDSWTREIDLYLPVASAELWSANMSLIERLLRFLTGDVWRIRFRPRQKQRETLIARKKKKSQILSFDSVALFSGGLDSFVGAIDLLERGSSPILVSHYKDASTKNQTECFARLSKQYSKIPFHHVRANVSFDKNDLPGLGTETTTRGRSFIFFALAVLVADSLNGTIPVYIPENGLISLNVPLDPLRLGAWSTRTTHPFYMARWQELLGKLGLDVQLRNPYRFSTKGEMLSRCENSTFLAKNYAITVSCSSISKGRWKGLSQGHCGYCTPCLIRRASVLAALGKDTTTYLIPDLSAQPLNGRSAEATDVRAFQMIHRRLSKDPGLAPIFVHKTGPLSDYSTSDLTNYAEVFKRGIAEVGTLVEQVRIS